MYQPRSCLSVQSLHETIQPPEQRFVVVVQVSISGNLSHEFKKLANLILLRRHTHTLFIIRHTRNHIYIYRNLLKQSQVVEAERRGSHLLFKKLCRAYLLCGYDASSLTQRVQRFANHSTFLFGETHNLFVTVM